MTTQPIYLDGFSTLPLAPEARAAMLAIWDAPGNASSPHAAGEYAARAIADARGSVADLIGAGPSEIIFTAGATEANNLAILGGTAAAVQTAPDRRRIVISSIEHKAVLSPAEQLAAQGYDVALIHADRSGRIDLDHARSLIDDTTLLVSVMLVNNETGLLQPVEAVAALAHRAGALIHSDAAQAAGKIPVDVVALDLDYLSLSAHKCYGPMGVGALYVAANAPKPLPLLFGGGQQAGIRPGTEAVPLIAGFGAAAELATSRLDADQAHGEMLATLLLERLAAHQLRYRRVGGDGPSVPGGFALQLDGIDAEMLCARLARTVAVSTGSACTAGQVRSSHVFDSMKLSDDEAASILRIFCHRYLEPADIVSAAEMIAAAAIRSGVASGRPRQ